MSRLPLITSDTADTAVEEVLATARRQLGGTPNMVLAMANSPALLRGYLALSDALSHGRLRPPVREAIALAIAQANRCDYCMSAHSFVASHLLHLHPTAIAAARQAHSDDPTTQAALQLATAINDARGGVTDEQLDNARKAGLDDPEITEIVGNVALNVLTNYLNKTANVDIDFPPVHTTTP